MDNNNIRFVLLIGRLEDFESHADLEVAYRRQAPEVHAYEIFLPRDMSLPPEFNNLQEVAHLMLHGMAFRNDWAANGTLSKTIID